MRRPQYLPIFIKDDLVPPGFHDPNGSPGADRAHPCNHPTLHGLSVLKYDRRNIIDYGVEALFRGTVVSFSRHFWSLRLRSGSRIPEGPCFIYGNHSNNYDPFMINAFTRWGETTAGVMTAEYMEDSPLGSMLSRVGILSTRKRVPEPFLVRKIYSLLANNRSFVIYPEGGRPWDGRPLHWIESTVKLFLRAGVPIYPILTHGSYVGWPRWATYPRPANIELEVLPPFHFDRNTPFEEALAQLKAAVDMDGNLVDAHIAPTRAFRPASGIHRLIYRDPVTGESGAVSSPDGTRIVNRENTLKWRMLPDSRILDESTGDLLLTGDIYESIRKFNPEPLSDRPMIQVQADIRGTLEKTRTFVERSARLSLFASHLLIEGKNRYHIPIEDVRYSSTERNDKLALTLNQGALAMHFRSSGSVLQWHDELLRSAPQITP